MRPVVKYRVTGSGRKAERKLKSTDKPGPDIQELADRWVLGEEAVPVRAPRNVDRADLVAEL